MVNYVSANDNQKMERFIREKYERKKYSSSAPPALRDFSALGLDGRPQVFLFWQMIPVKLHFLLAKETSTTISRTAKTKRIQKCHNNR